MRAANSFVAIAFLFIPSLAAAAPTPSAEVHPKPHRTARVHKVEAKGCYKAPIEIVAGGESATFSLAKCDGAAVPLAVDQLSILARPGGAPKPKVTVDMLSKGHGAELAPGIRRIDPRLVERLELAVDHFRKVGQPAKILVVSGYRPTSAGSYHQSGRALDLHIDGVQNEALVAFCKTMADTGCGYYPNSSFVHIDVREAGTGHVAWIDVSHPGESPKYVSSWPPPASSEIVKLPALPNDEPLDGREEPKTRRLDRHPYFF